MKEMKMAHWFIVVSLLLAGASMFSNNNVTKVVEEEPIQQETGNSAGSENWDYAITGSEVFDIEITRIWNNNAPTLTENGWYDMDRSGDQPRSFKVEFAALNNNWNNQEIYKINYQLWGVHDISAAGGSNIELVKHGLEERVNVPSSISSTIVEKQVSMVGTNSDKRPTGCYWVTFWVSTNSADDPDAAREQYISGISDRINFASGSDEPCLYDPNIEDNNGDGNDDTSFDAGCLAGGGSIAAADGSCTPSPWYDDQNDTDDYDDISYDHGFDDGAASVDITSDNASCDWQTHTWNGHICVEIIDITSDNPSCDWDTHTWNGTTCVDIVDITSDNDQVIAAAMPNCNWDTHTWNGQTCVEIVDSTSDDDGCGTCCADNATCQDDLIAANIKLIDADEDGVIDLWEDDGCTNTSSGSYVNSTGCAYQETDNPAGPSCPECSAGIEITGSGDAADLTVIGGAGLLAGIGVSSILGQTGRGPNTSGGGNKKPNIDLDDVGDVFDNLDLDLDADLDLDKPDVEKVEPRSRSGSDQYFKSGVERQKAMTDSGDSLLDDYVEEEGLSNTPDSDIEGDEKSGSQPRDKHTGRATGKR